MSVNHDSFVKTTLVDNSVAQPTPEPIPVGFSYLQPFFSRKGLDNVIQRFTGTGAFEKEYGSDIDSVKKYGHGGLIAGAVLSGGGIVDGCRLMPDDSTKASVVLGVAIGSHGEAETEKKYVRLVTKEYDFDVTLDNNLETYMIDPDGEEIVEVPTDDPEATAPQYYTVYPLIVAYSKGRGDYGNDLGIQINLDTSRDGKNKDGRRYVVRFYDGNVVVGDRYEFISASFNPAATVTPGSEVPDSYDVVFEDYAKQYNLPIVSYYSAENYESILDELKSFAGIVSTLEDTDKYLIDFIAGIPAKGHDYENIEFESPTMVDGIIKFSGGSDGSLNDPDTREQLLVDFYSGNIDKDIYDPRIIDAGITLDAWFPMAVKETMVGTFGSEVRDDIAIICDLGEEVSDLTTAISTAESLISSISHPYGSVAINIHNGRTRNRVKNIRTSGNYEFASGLPTLYRNQGSFTIYAGYISGRVRTMDFDFYPRVVKDDLEISPLRENNLIFAMKLDRSEDFFFMSDDSQYKSDYSVLGSLRNLIFAGEVIRTSKKVLVKYSYHPDDIEGAIPEASNELDRVFSGNWFPANIPVSFTIFQTRNDKITKNASCEISIDFPDVAETWKVTITANRQPLG